MYIWILTSSSQTDGSFICREKSSGPNIEPCGTPMVKAKVLVVLHFSPLFLYPTGGGVCH